MANKPDNSTNWEPQVLSEMVPISRYVGGDKPEDAWVQDEELVGTYIGYILLEFPNERNEMKKVPLFSLLDDSGTLVRFIGTSQLAEIIYLQAGSRLSVTFLGLSKSSRGRNIKMFRIRSDANFVQARADAVREQLRNPGSRLSLPAPMSDGDFNVIDVIPSED